MSNRYIVGDPKRDANPYPDRYVDDGLRHYQNMVSKQDGIIEEQQREIERLRGILHSLGYVEGEVNL